MPKVETDIKIGEMGKLFESRVKYLAAYRLCLHVMGSNSVEVKKNKYD